MNNWPVWLIGLFIAVTVALVGTVIVLIYQHWETIITYIAAIIIIAIIVGGGGGYVASRR